jgi:mRNA-degrading endonuclease HigB of HigAB toxin-antitoxin module
VKIVFPSALVHWARLHAVATPSLNAWKVAVEGAAWRRPSDIRGTWPKYSYIRTTCNTEGHGRVIFDIAGTDYRLVAHVSYKEHHLNKHPSFHGAVFLRWFGPHSAYSKIDWISSEVTNYE